MEQHSEKDKGIDEDGCKFFMTSGRKAIDVPENSEKELKDLKIIKKKNQFFKRARAMRLTLEKKQSGSDENWHARSWFAGKMA